MNNAGADAGKDRNKDGKKSGQKRDSLEQNSLEKERGKKRKKIFSKPLVPKGLLLASPQVVPSEERSPTSAAHRAT